MQVDFKNAPEGTTHCYAVPELIFNGEPIYLWQWSKVDRRGKQFFYDGVTGRWASTRFRNIPSAVLVENPAVASLKRLPAVLILGHGRHGKTTVAEHLTKEHGYTAMGSSEVCAELLKPLLDLLNGEKTAKQHHDERHELTDIVPGGRGNSEIWNRAISLINAVDKSALSRYILEHSDIYTGMREQDEYDASKHLFKAVLWVDAYPRVDYVDPTMHIEYDPATMSKIYNNGSIERTIEQIDKIAWNLRRGNYHVVN